MGKIVGLIVKEEKKSFAEPKVIIDGEKIIADNGKNKLIIDGDVIAKEVVKEEKKK